MTGRTAAAVLFCAAAFGACKGQNIPTGESAVQRENDARASTALPSGPSSTQPRRLALVIGNDRYVSAPPLANAGNDARAIYSAMLADGFDTTLALDVDLRQLALAIDKFVSELNPRDVALLYYSGHGVQLDGENYLIPTDFSAASEDEAKYAAYSVSRALQRISDRRTALNIVILDACRDNPFRVFSARSYQRGWAPMNAGKGTYVAFATAPGSTASDNPAGTNGLFTLHLLDALRQPGLGLDEVFGRVRASVYEASLRRQVPWSASSVIGDFIFTAALGNTEAMARVEGAMPRTAGVTGVDRRVPVVAKQPATSGRATVPVRSNYLDSIAKYTRLLNDDPHSSVLYRERGRARVSLQQFEPAIEDLSMAIGLDPTDFTAIYYRSLAYVGAHKYNLAIADSVAAIEQQPDLLAAYLARAQAYLGAGRYTLAVDDCTHVIAIKEDVGQAYAIRGAALAALGNSPAAISDFGIAAKLTLEHPQ